MLKNLMMGAAAVALSVTSMAGSANADLIIDDFTDTLENAFTNDGDGVLGRVTGTTGGVFDRSVQIGGTILGGDRELTVVNTSDTDSDPTTDSSNGDVTARITGSGVFTHSNDALVSGTSLIVWDGDDGADADSTSAATIDMGLGGINLSAAGDTFHLTVISADLTGSSMEVWLYTSTTQYSRASVDIPRVPADVPSPFEFYMSLLSIQAGTGCTSDCIGSGGAVDLTDVNAIAWFAIGSSNFDAAIDIVDIVPEPASLTLLGAGIMGLGYFGKRRKA